MHAKIVVLVLFAFVAAISAQQNPTYDQNYPQYDARDPPRELPYGQDGAILVRNGGLYVAIFYVEYKVLGRKVVQDSGDFGVGTSKSVRIPNQAEDITVTVKARTWFSGESTIFTEEFKYPVRRCYKIAGTTLGQTYNEVGC